MNILVHIHFWRNLRYNHKSICIFENDIILQLRSKKMNENEEMWCIFIMHNTS